MAGFFVQRDGTVTAFFVLSLLMSLKPFINLSVLLYVWNESCKTKRHSGLAISHSPMLELGQQEE
jgi:hypothetical protein